MKINKYIVDRKVTAISFIMDYIRLELDSVYISILTDPIISSEGQNIHISDARFCNTLRKLIGYKVVAFNEHVTFVEFVFSNKIKINVPLESNIPTLAEALIIGDTQSDLMAVYQMAS
jgi:hypothetical protein